MSTYNPTNTPFHCDPLVISGLAESYVVTSFSPTYGSQRFPIYDSENKVISYYVDETKENTASLAIEIVGSQALPEIGSTFTYPVSGSSWVIDGVSESRSRGAQKTATLNISEIV